MNHVMDVLIMSFWAWDISNVLIIASDRIIKTNNGENDSPFAAIKFQHYII